MDVLMPQLGETVAEGKIVKWFKQAGDAVTPGENLFEIETDKTSMEVPAIAAGTLADIRFQVGEVAKVGAVVAVIAGAGGEKVSTPSQPASPAKPTPSPLVPAKAGTQSSLSLDSRLRGNERSVRQSQAQTGGQKARDFAYPDMSPWREVRTPERNHGPAKIGGRQVTPLARRLASEQGIDLSRVAGSGPHGRIVAADIAAVPRTAAPTAAASQFHVVADIEIGRLLAVRDEAKAAGVEFSIGDFAVKAWAAALRRVTPQAGADVALVQIADGKRVTKVIGEAAGKSLSTIALEAGDSGTAAPGASAASAVHVLAMPGIREFSAVVTPPFTSVLAIGQPRRVPVEAEDGGVRFASQMTATLSCDARVIDDAHAAALLAVFKAFVENPVTALI